VLGRHYAVNVNLKHFERAGTGVSAVRWDGVDGTDGVLNGAELCLFE
jgi:hypothetical protein